MLLFSGHAQKHQSVRVRKSVFLAIWAPGEATRRVQVRMQYTTVFRHASTVVVATILYDSSVLYLNPNWRS